ncbi:MAG: PHP domain-containing protein [Clostridiales bacterium]|nr:PHP domain-containing protein [Clostridiales bacterium]
MKRRFDLHTHSAASDGTQTPAQLVADCAAMGLWAMALTDHDTVDGVEEARQAGDRLGIIVLSGVELSAAFAGELHILGYGVNRSDAAFCAFLRRQREERELRMPRMIARLRDLGVNIAREDVDRESRGEASGRPHLARALVRLGVCGSEQEAFDRFLARGKPAYVGRSLPSPREAISAIRAADGRAVLAHPGCVGLGERELEALVSDFARRGLWGLEVFYPQHSDAFARAMLGLCRRTGLVPTLGSDCHGPGRGVPPAAGWERFGPMIPQETYDAIDTLAIDRRSN